MWQLAVVLVLALLFLLDRLLLPSVRWVIRRKVNRVITEINDHLQIGIRPFQLTKRKVLIDRLVFDPLVLATMDAYANEKNMPREVAQEEVRRYAREIVPTFNAYVYFRLSYRRCRFVCRQLYRVRVGVVDEAEIRAIDRNPTVVFVMNHRSNIDYMLVAYLASRQITLSYAAVLMNGVGFVTPILPVPLIAQVFARSDKAALSELQIIAAMHTLMDELITAGAPLGAADLPAKITVAKALTALAHYGMLEFVDGAWRAVPAGSDRLAYYGASISHRFDELGPITPRHQRIGPAA